MADGAPLRTHLEAVHERTGQMPEQLARVQKAPAGCAQLWTDFNELHTARGSGLNGPEAIGFRDLKDWQDFTGVILAAWEIKAIRRADAAYFEWKGRQK